MTGKEKHMASYEATLSMLRSQYPCRECAYYTACGDPERTRECDGRKRLSGRETVYR